MRRQRGGLPLHFLKRQIVEPSERHSVGEPLELLAEFAQPEFFQRRVPKHNHDILRVWQHLQDSLNHPWYIDVVWHDGSIRRKKLGPDAALIRCSDQHRGFREKTFSMPHYKTQCREVDGHNQIKLATAITVLEEVHKQTFLFWFGKPRRIKGRLVDIDRINQLPSQRGPEGRCHGVEGPDVAAKRVDNEHSLGRNVRRGERHRGLTQE